MNNLIYVGVAIVIIAIVGFVILSGHGTTTPASTVATTVAASTQQTTISSTAPASGPTTAPSGVTTIYNPATTIPANTALPGCTAGSGFSCSNLNYKYNSANNTWTMSVVVGQSTGSQWSGFGVGYAPKGTPASSGSPPQIAFFTANASSSNGVGTLLQSGATSPPIALSGKGGGSTTSGTLWACYVGSGTLYVGPAGCTTSGGQPAQYLQIATINATSK